MFHETALNFKHHGRINKHKLCAKLNVRSVLLGCRLLPIILCIHCKCSDHFQRPCCGFLSCSVLFSPDYVLNDPRLTPTFNKSVCCVLQTWIAQTSILEWLIILPWRACEECPDAPDPKQNKAKQRQAALHMPHPQHVRLFIIIDPCRITFCLSKDSLLSTHRQHMWRVTSDTVQDAAAPVADLPFIKLTLAVTVVKPHMGFCT